MSTSVRPQRVEGGGEHAYSEILTLRPPPTNLESSVARPRGASIPWGLPMWDKKPLNSKLPLIQGPRGPVVFSRGKLGDKLWTGGSSSKFQLRDPYGHEVKFEYDPAHDHHLKGWLRRPRNLEVFFAQDLVTPSLRVKCSVQQYNTYRQFLYSLYSDALRTEAEHRENLALERLRLKKAQENAEKEVSKLKQMEDSSARRMSNFRKIDMLKMDRLENCHKRLQRVVDRSIRAEKQKEVDLVKRKERMAAFDNRIKNIIENGKNIERQNKIKAMKAWHRQDVEKYREFEKRKQQRQQEKRLKAEMTWKTKVEQQKRQIAKENYLQRQRMETMENNRQQYMKAMEKAWSRMADELVKLKCQNTLDKVKSKREASMRQIMRSVSAAYTMRKSIVMLSQDQDAIDTLKDRIQQTLREIRYDLEPYIVIAHAKARLERQENVPVPVSGAIKYLLEQTIVEYTAKHLSNTMNTVATKALSAIDELKNQPAGGENRSLSLNRSSLYSSLPYKQSVTSGRTARISEVEVIPVIKMSEELNVGIDELRRTRDRPPTPMPSVHTFTEVLFKDATDEETDDLETGHFSFIEQAKLKATITDVSNRILRMIPSRVRSVIESRSYDRLSVQALDAESMPENKPVSKLCSLILFEDMVRDYTLITVVDRVILTFMQDLELTPSFLRLKIKQRQEAAK